MYRYERYGLVLGLLDASPLSQTCVRKNACMREERGVNYRGYRFMCATHYSVGDLSLLH